MPFLISTGIIGAAFAATVAGSFVASTSAVIAGTQIMAATISTGGATMAGKMVLDNWGNSLAKQHMCFGLVGRLQKIM